MADKNTNIKLNLIAEIKNGKAVGDLSLSYEDLSKAAEVAAKSLKKVNKLSDSSSWSSVIYSTANALQALQSQFNSLSEAYAVQQQAETQLEMAMRNTMDATDGQIQSIKDLCSAQQELGVIGDEVQLAGAQQLTAFLSQKESLDSLIPAMNDLIAKQYGLNASSENASSIATALGKVLEGNTKSLQKYGITFTEAQKNILKTGTEMERVALITEVVEAKFGGVNAELAKTPAGKLQQLKNTMGDFKESLGKAVSSLAPFVNGLAQLGQAALGVGQLTTAFKSVKAAITASTIATKTLSVALKGLGIGLAIGAVTAAIAYFTSKTEEATAAVEGLKEAEDAFSNAYAQATAEIQGEIRELERLISTNGDTAAAVDNLNAKYGESFGYYQTAAEWLEIMRTKTIQYAKAKAYEAQITSLATKIAKSEIEREALEDKKQQLEESGNTTTTVWAQNGSFGGMTAVGSTDSKEYSDLKKKIAAATAAEEELNAELTKTIELSKSTFDELGEKTHTPKKTNKSTISRSNRTTESTPPPEGSLAWYDSQIKDIKGKIELAVDTKSRIELDNQLKELERRKYFIELRYKEPDQTLKAGDVPRVPVDLELPDKSELNDKLGAALNTLVPNIDTSKYDEIIAKQKKMAETAAMVGRTSQSFQALSSALGNLSGVMDNAAGAWLNYASQMLGAIPELIKALTALGIIQAGEESTKAGPFGWIQAIVAMAAMTAAFASVPKFAKGGIAYGPTLGLFGEYSGASTNPEVVAPLDRLKTLLEPRDNLGGNVVFEIEGRKLKGVLQRVERFDSRTR